MDENNADETTGNEASDGPDGSQAKPSDAEHRPGETDGPPQECSFSSQDEVAEAFKIEPIAIIISPLDNLPIPQESDILATAPRFSEDTVCCIADEREFVEIFSGEIEPNQHGGGLRLIRGKYDKHGSERDRLKFTPDRVKVRYGNHFVSLSDRERDDFCISVYGDTFLRSFGSTINQNLDESRLLAVRPIREQCDFYKRQVFGNDEQPDPTRHGHRVLHRLCTARRSNGGGYMSLRDEAVYACDIRSPRHFESEEKYLDAPDRERLTTPVENVPLFNIRS